MAPVAGGITNAEQHWKAEFSCSFKRFVTPCIPVDRIVGMLEKIGGAFKDQAVDIDGSTIFSKMSGTGFVVIAFCGQRFSQYFFQGW